MIKHWIAAARLRTLPLALAIIGTGTACSIYEGYFNIEIGLLTLLTTFLLQILSNLANDYGDTQNGADSKKRLGPQRTVQAGLISSKAMLRAIILLAILSLASGIYLLSISLDTRLSWGIFLGMGLLSILAAITYTAGSRPYGYAGLGDASVFFFFGIVAVFGTYHLQTQMLDYWVLLPATTMGCFSVAVLNVNNIRDIESDKAAGKYTIPVRVGRKRAVLYHWVLTLVGVGSMIAYMCCYGKEANDWLFLLPSLLMLFLAYQVQLLSDNPKIDRLLRATAFSTLVFVSFLVVGAVM